MREYVAASQDARDAGEAPPKVRLITTVAREHKLEYVNVSDGMAELRSKSLRCDDSYCADPIVDAFERTEGVRAVERRLSDDPPSITVEFDVAVTDAPELARALAAELNAGGDPLYERPLDIIESNEN
jgi:hypothetical protein